ncbi:oligogalacturonate-specific porin KdgM family protein [Vibrio sp. YMD68]|uniref:oligogalacturonate-specific porin KdgM family protein n=1 Tax=Vibrio sp. YMD68 TaxID=3042300 RepID=UPI00249AD403|nr:oligogalacturonate-specific porin KdgM family protein [Vibrio sp. YMD68]WGW01396.1 oligogalacturonate-specific porin KdgM family protein [Vibrio sp. YMD68]
MKVKLLISSLLLALTSASASAASINLRHEYMPDRDGDQHRDRITVSHRFANGIGFSVEAKWKHDDDNFLGGLKSGGHEVGVSYNYKINDTFTLQPSYAADVSSTSATHKYNIRAIAKITDNWGANVRYRYGDQRRVNSDNSSYHQINVVTDYRLSWGKVGVDLEYKDLESGQGGWKDKDQDHLVNFFGEYSLLESGWVPFAEIGFVTNDKNDNGVKDDHSIRYRVGVKYSF